MRNIKALIFLLLLVANSVYAQKKSTTNKAVFVIEKTWVEARALHTDTTIVVIPIGAAAKEHGPHLLLQNDFLMAEYYKERIAKTENVVIYPTVNYQYYPAFLEYAGSTSLKLETAVDVLVDLCRSISTYGPKKFYFLNTGVSTNRPLQLASEKLAKQGIMMRYTDLLSVIKEAEAKVKQQSEGTHADEIETSQMLYMAPQTVNMKLATKNIPEKPEDRLTLKNSPSGIYGDATLATREKGEIVTEAAIAGIRKDIQQLRLAKPIVNSLSDIPSRILGTFQIAPNDTVRIFQEDGKIIAQRNTKRKAIVVRESENSFYADTQCRLVFFQDYKTVYLHWGGEELLAHRK